MLMRDYLLRSSAVYTGSRSRQTHILARSDILIVSVALTIVEVSMLLLNKLLRVL